MTAAGSGAACPSIEGELWVWGFNGNYTGQGHLGLGDTTDRCVPTQVGSGTNWTNNTGTWQGTVHHMIKSDGTLWGWGNNVSGNLGVGDTSNYSSPVQIGSDTDWAFVDDSWGEGYHTTAIRTDGTLWTWGENGSGQLGLGDKTDRSSPVQVGSLTDWAACDGSSKATICLKTDGTIWGFGGNHYGCLGLGDTTGRCSPVQIGSDSDWLAFEFTRWPSVTEGMSVQAIKSS